MPNGEKVQRIDIADYPTLKKHLDKFYLQLQKRTDKGTTPYNLRNCAYVEDFGKEKIVYQTLARTGNAFNYDNAGFFVPNSAYILVGENLKYLVGLLNSKIMLWYLDINFAKLDETGWSWIKDSVEKLPIPKINAKNQKIADKIMNLVDKVLESKAQSKDSTTLPYANATPPCHTTSHPCHTEALAEVSQKQKRDFSHSTNAQNDKTIKNCNDKSNHRDISPTAQNDKTNKSQYDTTDLESQIDELVYKLYDLDSSEIKIIESK